MPRVPVLLLAGLLAACGTSDNSTNVDDVGTDQDSSADGSGETDAQPDADEDAIVPPDAGDVGPDVDGPDAPDAPLPDVDPDVVPDAPEDTVPDAPPDVDPDTDPDADVAPDGLDDAAPDVAPDVAPDADPDVEPDTDADLDVLPICTVDEDCDADEVCDDAGRCQPAPCANGLADGDETDVDCGGGSCAPCPEDGACLVDEDCDTERCAIDADEEWGICVACAADSDCGGTDWCDVEAGRCAPSPCTATSCTAAPIPACDGDTAITYETNGVCTSPGGVLRCAYDVASTTDCAARGFPCEAGVCQDPCAGRDLCEIPGTACVGDTRVQCARDGDGCLVRTASDCALRDGTCSFSGGTAQCVDICSTRETCTEGPPGDRCEGNARVTCAVDADGCLVETAREFCGTSTCDPDAGCVSVCDAAAGRALTCGTSYVSTTAGGQNLFTGFTCTGPLGSGFEYGGPEAVMEIRLPETQAVTLNALWAANQDYDLAVVRAVASECGPTMPCEAISTRPTGNTESLTFVAQANTTYYAVITVFGAARGVPTDFSIQTVCQDFVCGDGVVTVESCDDGNTDDGDGCSSSCAIEPNFTCVGEPSVCTLAPDTCATRATLELPAPNETTRRQGSTISATDRFRASCGGGASGPDHVYELVVPETMRLVLETTAPATTFDTVLHIRAGETCVEGPAVDYACNDDVASGVRRSRIDGTFAPGRYFVIVDGFGNSRGAYELEISRPAPAPAP